MDVATPHDWQARKVKNWLLAISRFSLTLGSGDELAVMAMADEIDRLGFIGKRPSFSFFQRTSIELCNAIKDGEYLCRKLILRSHLARIDEHRLRRAFCAAAGLEREDELKSIVPFDPDRARRSRWNR
jgi:hypothetical protein